MLFRSFADYRYLLIATLVGIVLVPFLSSAATSSTASSSALLSTTSPATPVVTPPPPVDTTKTFLSVIAQNRIKNLAANVSNRLDATLRRLTNVADRIKNRIEKNAAADIDTTAASVALSEANGHLMAAGASLRHIDQDVAAFIGSSNPLTGFIRLKTIYSSIYTELRATHTALLLSLHNLDGTISSATATTTATNITQ